MLQDLVQIQLTLLFYGYEVQWYSAVCLEAFWSQIWVDLSDSMMQKNLQRTKNSTLELQLLGYID